jgi:predicted transcriptional regulator of viral defense system
MAETRTEQIIRLARELGMLRPRDLQARNIPHAYLQELYKKGQLERRGRGIYTLPELAPTENASLAEACKRIPHGIVCLLSALRFHNLGTQNPFEVWMAIDRKARLPRLDYPPLRIVRFSGLALSEGVEQHPVEEGMIRVYNPAKTVVDCFRYRNKIGLDVALEALRECRRQRRATMDELWHYATLLRVSTVMRPYLEALV